MFSEINLYDMKQTHHVVQTRKKKHLTLVFYSDKRICMHLGRENFDN